MTDTTPTKLHLFSLRTICYEADWHRVSPVIYSRYVLDDLARLGLIELRTAGGPEWPWREARATAKGREVSRAAEAQQP